MGAKSSKIGSESTDNLSSEFEVVQRSDQLARLGFTDESMKCLFEIFVIISNKAQVFKMNQLLAYVDAQGVEIRIVKKIFQDETHDFYNFVDYCTHLWSFCTLDFSGLGAFVFDMYDTNHDGLIENVELIEMFSALYGNDYENDANAKVLQAKLEEDSTMDRIYFCNLCHHNQFMLYPITTLQVQMQSKFGGVAFWTKLLKTRKEKFGKQYISIHLILLSILDSQHIQLPRLRSKPQLSIVIENNNSDYDSTKEDDNNVIVINQRYDSTLTKEQTYVDDVSDNSNTANNTAATNTPHKNLTCSNDVVPFHDPICVEDNDASHNKHMDQEVDNSMKRRHSSYEAHLLNEVNNNNKKTNQQQNKRRRHTADTSELLRMQQRNSYNSQREHGCDSPLARNSQTFSFGDSFVNTLDRDGSVLRTVHIGGCSQDSSSTHIHVSNSKKRNSSNHLLELSIHNSHPGQGAGGRSASYSTSYRSNRVVPTFTDADMEAMKHYQTHVVYHYSAKNNSRKFTMIENIQRMILSIF